MGLLSLARGWAGGSPEDQSTDRSHPHPLSYTHNTHHQTTTTTGGVMELNFNHFSIKTQPGMEDDPVRSGFLMHHTDSCVVH